MICIKQEEFLLSNVVLLKTPDMVPFVSALNVVCGQFSDNAKTKKVFYFIYKMQ